MNSSWVDVAIRKALLLLGIFHRLKNSYKEESTIARDCFVQLNLDHSQSCLVDWMKYATDNYCPDCWDIEWDSSCIGYCLYWKTWRSSWRGYQVRVIKTIQKFWINPPLQYNTECNSLFGSWNCLSQRISWLPIRYVFSSYCQVTLFLFMLLVSV